jgi:hypothetical protein
MNLKNWLYLSNLSLNSIRVFFTLMLFYNLSFSQIANYIQNGSFELTYNCNWPNDISKAKFWRSIDSVNYGNSLYESNCFPLVPNGTFGYQFARTGNVHALLSILCVPPACGPNNRGHIRNRLKSTLISGKTYCVKFYVNITDNSSYGIDAIGAYFGGNTLDTITQINIPLTYLTPQVQNPTGNVITDTMNWTLITGTFVANGTEKHCVIGNFKSDAATVKTYINPNNFPNVYTNVLLDDVSCIPTDLPAYAGADIWGIPSTTVYIGRQRDVGIDEACTWYNMSNTVTPIANAAGLTLTVALSTQTYMVKQDICGIIKYDTVVVFASALGNYEWEKLNESINVFPNPANDHLYLQSNLINGKVKLDWYDALGQLIREEELTFENSEVKLNTSKLQGGIYFLNITTEQNYVVKRRFVIAR